MKRIFLLPLSCISFIASSWAYGPDGHALVGAVADKVLHDSNPPTAAKIATLLDGITLEEAANLPDKIKSWDKPEGPRNRWFHLPDHPEIERQLREFWRANPHLAHDPENHETVAAPDHHWFHYVDVPAFKDEKYADAITGISKWDVVHMISFCGQVLNGDLSETNERKISKPIAVILLAHYVGDIHQPLHVGSEYFGANGKPLEPVPGVKFYDDQGGNKLLLKLEGHTDDDAGGDDDERDGANSQLALKLHSFWDGPAVASARRVIKGRILAEQPTHSKTIHKAEYVSYLASHAPTGTQMPASLAFTKWSERWADEIQPLAHEAHERLDFTGVHVSATGHTITTGIAKEKDLPESYEEWAGEKVADELAKGGARLAAILKKTVQ